jgi:hypothetical protein
LANILHREAGVPQSWKDRVAVFFIKSAQFVAAIDEQGHLRVKASRDGRPATKTAAAESEIAEESEIIPPPTGVRYKRVAGLLNVAPKTWTFSDGDRTLLVEAPRDITAQEWEVLNQYVQFINPKGKTK